MQTSHTTNNSLEATDAAVNQVVENNAVVVFSLSYCPFCVQAKGTLASNGVSAYVVEVDQCENKDDLKKFLNAKYDLRTYPKVFIKNKKIGGNDDLNSVVNGGQLQTKLNA